MAVDERRRAALYDGLAASIGDEAASTLFELLPAAGDEAFTKRDADERFERRIADAVTAQTRTLVFSQLAALVAIAALAFGLR